MIRIFLTIFTIVFLLSCENEENQPIEENPLLGKWTEQFNWTNIFDCMTVGWETFCPEVTEVSTIEFSENTFEVKILPPSRTFITEDDTLYVGWASDTLFAGSYEISNDTVFFYIGDLNDPTKMRYWFQNDSLSVTAVSGNQMVIMDGDTSYISTFPMASFMWGSAWGKTHGIFGKIE